MTAATNEFTFATCPDCGEKRILKCPLPARATGRCRRCAEQAKPARRKGVWRSCAHCGTSFFSSSSRSKHCSMRCRRDSGQYADAAARASRMRKGKDNPNYRHGNRAGENIRAFTLALKGERVCRNCGSGEWLALHHSIPRSTYAAGREELLNGIPLCAVCHRKWHAHTLTITRDVFTQEEWSWMSTQELTGRQVTDWLDRHYPESAP